MGVGVGARGHVPRWRSVGVALSVLFCLAATGIVAVAAPAERAVRSTPQAVAVVYRGPASCPGCSEAAAALLRRSPLGFEVSYIGPREKRKVIAANLRGVDLYVQPGGDGSVRQGMRSLGRRSARVLKAYVANGGRYVGFCMGAYLAGSGPGMGLLAPGNTGQYSQTRGAEVTTAADAVVPLRWGRSLRHQYAQDPPYIIPSGVRGERVLSRFTNGKVNALVRPYGRGAVGVVGTHPEATRDWYTRRLWRQDRDGLDGAQGSRLIAAVMRL